MFNEEITLEGLGEKNSDGKPYFVRYDINQECRGILKICDDSKIIEEITNIFKLTGEKGYYSTNIEEKVVEIDFEKYLI